MSEREGREIVPVGEASPGDAPKPSHGDSNVHAQSSQEAIEQRESGQPGGGAGRRDDVGRTGVYPMSGDERPQGDAKVRPLADWAGGDRGIAGYEDSGGSGLVMRDGVVLGGLTSDGAGRPTIDIHGNAPAGDEPDDAGHRGSRRAAEAPPADEQR